MLLTRKGTTQAVGQPRLSRGLSSIAIKTMDRRTFLKRSGVGVGGAAVAAQMPFSMIGKAEAKEEGTGGEREVKRSAGNNCSGGCAVDEQARDGGGLGE